MEIELLFCENCVAANELKDEILKRGYVIPKCKICHSENVKGLPATDQLVTRILRALIRLHYSEWDYNHHVGGETLQDLVYGNKQIFNLNPDSSELDFEEAFLKIEEIGWYPKDSKIISLGGNYSEGWILNSIGGSINYELLDIVRSTFQFNYYELEDAVSKQIEKLLPHITSSLSKDSLFWRGRVGIVSRYQSQDIASLFIKEVKYLPFKGSEISAPPFEKASEGRLNKNRVSLLYLASDIETAIAELRPHPGHLISLGQFKSIQEITFANFANHDIRDFLSDELLDNLNHIISISKILNFPVQPENKSLYMATQLFADGIRKAGFRGVLFKSSMCHGTNFTSFYPDDFEYVDGSDAVHKVESLKYETKSLQTFKNTDDPKDFKLETDYLTTVLDAFGN